MYCSTFHYDKVLDFMDDTVQNSRMMKNSLKFSASLKDVCFFIFIIHEIGKHLKAFKVILLQIFAGFTIDFNFSFVLATFVLNHVKIIL